MLIRWIADSRAQNLESSTSASDRYRIALPAKALRGKGHTVDIVRLHDLVRANGIPDIVVIGKLFPDDDQQNYRKNASALLGQASALHAVADVCDNHFNKPVAGDYWRELVGTVNACTVASPEMGDPSASIQTGRFIRWATPSGPPKESHASIEAGSSSASR
jgi:hypothetical protein